MIVEYKGYYLSGSIVRQHMTGSKSLGILCVAGKLGSMTEVKRIPGRYFETSEQAQQHGLELAKQWVDDHAKDRSSE
jgi:O-succinylbenzoate synthase